MIPARVAALLATLCASLLLTPPTAVADDSRTLHVATKVFTESYILGEIAAQLLESEGFEIERSAGLGGTLIAFEALRAGHIDLYPEYTGTLTQAVLDSPGMDDAELSRRLQAMDLQLAVFLGFNNSYAMGVRASTAVERGITRVSDLADHPDLVAGFSHEFLNRGDGWPALSAAYGLAQQPVGIEHALAYAAIENGDLDLTDAYTTDGELTVRDIALLEDDRGFFPGYSAVLLARADLPTEAAAALRRLDGALDASTMQALNYRVATGGEEPGAVAADFLRTSGLATDARFTGSTRAQRVLHNTLVHLRLTGTALLLACLVAIPLALWLSRHDGPARALLYVTGLVQTIPALALLALMIPLVGLGELPAILALFLYSLLPIARNTLTGLFNIDPLLRQVATGMGLSYWQRIRHIEVPLAMPTLLAGVKTAAIISIGTATLAAFVGAGGLGEPIITGLNLNDHALIMEGAIPAALLAIAVELLFDAIERLFVPAHLRQQPRH